MEQKTKKTTAIIVIIAIAIILILIIVLKPKLMDLIQITTDKSQTEQQGDITTPDITETTTTKPIIDEWTGVPPNQMPSAKFNPGENIEVIYTDAGFAPQTLTVKTGKVVTFKNLSSVKVWPASDEHPTHAVYPTTGGCLGSTFDACRSLAPNDSWSFKFDILGTWKYHDHLNPSKTGTIVVEK
ncbi:MAG: hypothetical protein QMD65_02765 [Patescibacteria group bacterium]|nr:hypothetical protein [Patescibacteria group bacterium]